MYKPEHDLEFSENAKVVASQKYTENDETICQIFDRVARALSSVSWRYQKVDDFGIINREIAKEGFGWLDNKIEEFYEVMRSKKFMPAGRTLTNAGTKDSVVVANCVVLDIEDSMQSIVRTQGDAVLLQQQGCGVGFNFSNLRPAGYPTKRSRGKASGPISFMRMYNDSFLTIKQQGRSGANMGMLNIYHPDIYSFISCKEKEGDLSTFNISVVVNDEFMHNVKHNPKLQFVCTFNGVDCMPRQVTTRKDKFGIHEEVDTINITHGDMWDRLCEFAHRNGEPGIMFYDTVNKSNPVPGLGPIVASNPCGEQMLHGNDNCNLGSINLAAFYDPKYEDDFDYVEFRNTIRTAVEMLDNTIDLFEHSVPAINEMAKANRRVGLGVMGFADLLYLMNIRYGSIECRDLIRNLMSKFRMYAKQASAKLANERGNFPNFNESIFAGVERMDSSMRNCAVTTVAPTGSISMLCDVNGGIEPYFRLGYKKSTRSGDLNYVPKSLLQSLRNNGFNEGMVEHIGREIDKGSIMDILNACGIGITDLSYMDAYVTTMDVTPAEHVQVQAAFQLYIDNSISKTTNLSNSATVQDVKDTFMFAWENSCKSITVYRDGSRKDQILEKIKDGLKDRGYDTEVKITNEDPFEGVDEELIKESARKFGWGDIINKPVKPVEVDKTQTIEEHHQELREQGLENLIISENGEHHHVAPRPKVVQGYTEKVATARGNAYITINCWDYNGETKPFEVFVAIGKEGGELHSDMSAITRMITLALRYGVPTESVIKHLKNIGATTFWDSGLKNEGPVDAISQVLQNVVNSLVIGETTKVSPKHTSIVEATDLYIRRHSDWGKTVEEIKEQVIDESLSGDVCPNCSSSAIIHTQGCKACVDCNWSSC